MRRITLVYLAGMAICAVMLAGLNTIGMILIGFGIPKAASALSVVVPALMAGVSFVNGTGRRPERREAWALSLWFTLVQIVTAAILLWGYDIFATGPMSTGATMGILVVLFGVLLIGARLGLGLGVFYALRQAELSKKS